MELKGKIVAFDLDGTLTESNQLMESDMAETLFRLLQKTKVAIISGASFSKMKEQLDALLVISEFSQNAEIEKNLYLLPTNGTVIYQYKKLEKDWAPINAPAALLEDREKIVEALNEIISSKRFGIPEIGQGEFINDRGNQISLAGLGEKASLEEKRVWDPDHKKREEIKKELEGKLSNVEIVIGGNSTIDILPKGFNKSVGILNFLKMLYIPKEDIVFLGDAIFPGGNDYSMKEAGYESIKVSGPKETEQIIKGFLQ